MKIKKLTWDSNFFQKNIGELHVENAHLENPVLENFDLIVLKQKEDFEVQIPPYTQTFKETKVVFEKKLTTENLTDFSEIEDTDKEGKSFAFFRKLAYESGKHSRFLLDENFGTEKFRKLYDEWIINSLNKKFAIKTFYLQFQEKAVGFVTIQQSENIGKIGLIATSREFQGKGFGKKLLLFAENYCLKNGMNIMEIPTQKENHGACIFYEKLGYKIKEELIIKHFWKHDPI